MIRQSLIFVAALLCWSMAASCDGNVKLAVPLHSVESGPFVVLHTETGELQSASGELISAPRVRGQLKIVRLFPEGEQVDEGDLILLFDRSEFEKEVRDSQGQLDKAQAELTKLEANQQEQMSSAEMDIQQQEAAYKLSQISAEKTVYGTDVEKQEAEIQVKQAERRLAEAKARLEAYQVVHRVNIEKQHVRIARQEKYLRRAQNDYDRLSIKAHRPGIVVYEKIRKQNDSWEKVSVGDQVWGRTPVISLPDLNQMQVLCHIGEMDITRIAVGQRTLIRLDAFPGPVFNGTVGGIAPMASASERNPNLQVFEMTIDIDERDERLKPGMSAQVEIIVDRVDDALSVPLQALFKRDGADIVYVEDGGDFEAVEVALGPRNDTSVIIENGLRPGQRVALDDPSVL